MNLRRFIGLTALASLALTGCSLSGSVPEPTAMPATSAAASPTASTTTSAIASSEVTSASITAEPAAPTTEPAPNSEPAPAPSSKPEPSDSVNNPATMASTEIAAPGTNCGASDPAKPQVVVYIFGGDVSCATALEVVREYNHIASTQDLFTYSRDGVAEGIQGYTCGVNRGYAGGVAIVSGQMTLCTNDATAGYVEVRSASERIIPGYTASVSKHINLKMDGDAGIEVTFQTPSGNIKCRGVYEKQDITCYTRTADGILHGAALAPSGAARYETASESDRSFEAISVDAGTSMNALGVSCVPQGADAIRCINSTNGFTLSAAGISYE